MTTIRTVMPKVLRVFFPQFLACVIAAPALAQSQFPPDPDIRAAFHRVKVPSGNVGVVIGLLEADRSRRVLTIGNQAYDSSTLFEIGSITKVFTGILLGEMHERGEVKLNQPVRELLPEGVTVPSRNGREITLVDLATHSSGLPRMPDNFQPADWSNPYVDYTVAQLYDFLRRYQLPRDIGAISEYSNLGVGLLGHALSLRADTSYGALVRMRILDPLGMSSTVIAIPDSLKPRLAPGHDAAGNRVNNWDVHTLAGAGALRSSAHDLLTFLEANLSPPQGSTLGRAIRRSHVIHFRRSPTSGSGLGWGVSTSRFGRPILAHDGGTAGYRSFAAFDPERRIGVVVLSNQSIDVTRIGLHMLDARTPITTSGLARAFSIIALVLAGLLVTGVFFAWRRTNASRGQALKAAAWMAFGVFVWMFMTGMAAALGLLRFDTLPPTMAIVFVLTLVLSVGLGRSRVGARLAALPLAVLVGAQAFRLPLELAMHRAYEHGLMPVQMSYSGLNFDIVTGILAIVVAVLIATGIAGVRTVRIWNLLGTLLLINVLVIAWLSAPTPLRVFKNDPSNAWIAGQPYIWLPTVMVAFAILGHVIVFRRLRSPDRF